MRSQAGNHPPARPLTSVSPPSPCSILRDHVGRCNDAREQKPLRDGSIDQEGEGVMRERRRRWRGTAVAAWRRPRPSSSTRPAARRNTGGERLHSASSGPAPSASCGAAADRRLTTPTRPDREPGVSFLVPRQRPDAALQHGHRREEVVAWRSSASMQAFGMSRDDVDGVFISRLWHRPRRRAEAKGAQLRSPPRPRAAQGRRLRAGGDGPSSARVQGDPWPIRCAPACTARRPFARFTLADGSPGAGALGGPRGRDRPT